VITGTTSPEQLDENLVAAEVVDKLTDDVLEIIEKTIKNIPE
jgi:aryl-alcohol dehydrogenase-like predicted oxidoreductase